MSQKTRVAVLHSVSNSPPFQKSRRDTTVVATVGSEQREMPVSSLQHNLQQIVDVATDVLSKCSELEALNLKREESQRSNATSDDPSCLSDMTAEGSEQRIADIFASDIERTLKEIADVAADLLSKCFELLDFEASNKESGSNSVPNSVRDSPVLRGLSTEDVKVSEQGSIGTDFTEDAKCHEALQHIADIAADLLYRCFVLLDFLSRQKKQTNLLHEIGDRQLSSQMKS